SPTLQDLIALEIVKRPSPVTAHRARNRTGIVASILQRGLNVCDHLVRKQIAVGVNRAVVIVIALQWIVTPGRVPIASVQKIISGGNENDRVTMTVPPVPIMPLVPITAQRVRIP